MIVNITIDNKVITEKDRKWGITIKVGNTGKPADMNLFATPGHNILKMRETHMRKNVLINTILM
jgi:hypothetical protein